MVVTQQRLEEAERLIESDPGGPIPSPSIPRSDRAPEPPPFEPAQKIAYTVSVVCPTSPEGLEEMYAKVSDLHTMADRPPSSELTLSRRLRASIDEGRDLLRSLGYYEGVAEGTMERDGEAWKVTVTLTPGPLYHLEPGRVDVAPEVLPADLIDGGGASGGGAPGGAAADPSAGLEGLSETWPGRCPVDPCPADTLGQAGLVAGAPARADDVLAAVERLAAIWRDGGYPMAEIAATRYSIDPAAKTLSAEAAVWPGPFATMGRVAQIGHARIADGYLEAHVNWRRGQPWSQSLAEAYRESLMRTGLFKAVEISPGLSDPEGDLVMLDLDEAPARTVSGSVNYDSDFGPGVAVSWEHRNLTGWGDKLRIDVPVWADLIQIGASYRRPFFLSLRQNLLLEAAALKENAEAYSLESVSAAAGVERQFNRKIRGMFRVTLERGSLEEEPKPRADYSVLGLPATMEWSDADSLLDATRGARVSLLVSPYYGHYLSDFAVVKYRVDASLYRPISPGGELVLALRAAMGAITGTGPRALPSSLRFFAGGGKSIRGYEYQSIGPKNEKGRPAGGAAVNEVGAELRWRFSETMGVTAFVDGGNVYDELSFSKTGRDFLWGGGLGFRYYSPIGPFRLDLATPLTPREGDHALQIYLSLGQSF